jgi:hypothetical protein
VPAPWIGEAMEPALPRVFALQRSMQRFIEFVLDNLFASKYTIVKRKLQVKRSGWKRVEIGNVKRSEECGIAA